MFGSFPLTIIIITNIKYTSINTFLQKLPSQDTNLTFSDLEPLSNHGHGHVTAGSKHSNGIVTILYASGVVTCRASICFPKVCSRHWPRRVWNRQDGSSPEDWSQAPSAMARVITDKDKDNRHGGDAKRRAETHNYTMDRYFLCMYIYIYTYTYTAYMVVPWRTTTSVVHLK